jgi:hypothetical protein
MQNYLQIVDIDVSKCGNSELAYHSNNKEGRNS